MYEFLDYVTYNLVLMLVVLIGLSLFINRFKATFRLTHFIFTIALLLTCLASSAISVYASAIAADELGLAGASGDMYLFLATLLLAGTNLLIAYLKYKGSARPVPHNSQATLS